MANKKTKKEKRGRKPLDDKAIKVSIYPRESTVEKIGGIETAKEIALKAINNKGK